MWQKRYADEEEWFECAENVVRQGLNAQFGDVAALMEDMQRDKRVISTGFALYKWAEEESDG